MAPLKQILLVCETPNRSTVVQAGQPAAQMGAWLIDIPDGSDAATTAVAFATAQQFPVSTIAYLIPDASTIAKFQLESNWVPM